MNTEIENIHLRARKIVDAMSLHEKIAQVTGIWKHAEEFLNQEKYIDHEKLSQKFPYGFGQIGRIFEGLSAQEMAKKYNEIQRYCVEKTRLGIPVLFHEECLRGVMEVDALSFPHPIALAASFNTDLVEQTYSYIAKDARSRGARLALTPVLDIARDPRWGRVEETFGEDPVLVARMATAAVKGLQGTNNDMLPQDKVMATLKHFAAHGSPEGGMNCAPPGISERDFKEICLYPFAYTIRHAKPKAIMPSYNEIEGVPSHANQHVLQTILRKELGFEGFVVSDYYSIEQLHELHFVAKHLKDAAIQALEAGVDIELPEPNCYAHLFAICSENAKYQALLDAAVCRLIYYKIYAGLFDSPYVDESLAHTTSEDAPGVELSYSIAAESAILLTNKHGILPLSLQKYATIAVIGPNADYNSIGGYACANKDFVTIYKGITEKWGAHTNILYAKGCGITTDEGSWFTNEVCRTSEEEDRVLLAEAVKIASQSDLIILCVGGNEQTCREAWNINHLGDRPSLELVGLQMELFEKLYELGKPIVVVLSHGRPLVVSALQERASAILDCWYLGQETGSVVADILSGVINPSGKLAISYPRSAGHIPVFYNHKPSARRGYLFDDVTPLFPFGFGLSYTNFELSNICCSASSSLSTPYCSISLTIQNTGTYAGAEVVQVYVRDVVSSVTRPVKELKAFTKVFIQPGESRDITLELHREDFEMFNRNMQRVVEAGDFEILIGTSSNNTDLQVYTHTVEE